MVMKAKIMARMQLQRSMSSVHIMDLKDLEKTVNQPVLVSFAQL